MTNQPTITVHTGDERFQALCARHTAFWEGAPTNSLLRAATVDAGSVPVRLPQADGSVITHAERLDSDMIDPGALIDEIEAWDPSRLDGTLRAQGQYMVTVGAGDLMPHCGPLLKVPWPEAILGCPLKMTEGQIWDGRYPGDPRELIERGSNFEHNPWFQLYFEFSRQLQDRLGNRFPLGVNSFRGPSDLVAADSGPP